MVTATCIISAAHKANVSNAKVRFAVSEASTVSAADSAAAARHQWASTADDVLTPLILRVPYLAAAI